VVTRERKKLEFDEYKTFGEIILLEKKEKEKKEE